MEDENIINNEVKEFSYKGDKVNESNINSVLYDILNTHEETPEGNFLQVLDYSKNIQKCLKEYLEIRKKLFDEFKIKKIQEKISNKLFSVKNLPHEEDLLFYDPEKYYIDANETGSEIIKVKETDILGHKIKEAFEDVYSEEREIVNYKHKTGDNNLVDLEAYCSEDESGDSFYNSHEENSDLNDFITEEKENFDRTKTNAVLMDIENDRKEIEELENYYDTKYNGKKVKSNDSDDCVLEDNLTEDDESISIEEFNYDESSEEMVKNEIQEDFIAVEKVDMTEKSELPKTNKLNSFNILNKYKNTKNTFKGFKK
ncbi:hypothetical protein EHP00_615 [Ecytonucleospora hepatopenaei]|uniref:Uncharacterized protein n=1 Tax=Ecytonucleospora hepatopenaei TaxID=646526 RepID=A0A1W0E7V6_9MICR|nr:hypothetical protein EHP00_615 [Ecytonucleospora hepatopenaei]